MKQVAIILLLIISCTVYSQEQTGTVKVKKLSCCNALDVGLTTNYYFKDTITYSELVQEKSLKIYSTYCKRHASYPVISFELSINNNKPIKITGNQFSFSKLGMLRDGGKITISNCKVNCKMVDTIPQIVIINQKDIFITK